MKSILHQLPVISQLQSYLSLKDLVNVRTVFKLGTIPLVEPMRDDPNNDIQITEINDVNAELIDYLSPQGCKVTGKSGHYFDFTSGLYWAIRRDNFKMIKYLFDLGVDPNQWSRDGYDLDDKHIPRTKSTIGIQLLADVVRNKNLEMVELFLQSGADPNVFINGWTELPLYAAIRRENLPIIKLLLDYGANPNYYLNSLETQEFETCRIQEYNNHIIRPQYGDDLYGKPIFLAILTQNCDILELLIQKGVSIEIKDEEGFSPLEKACDLKSLPVAQCLLKHGAKPELNPNGYFDLFYGEMVCSEGDKWAKENGLNLTKIDLEHNIQ